MNNESSLFSAGSTMVVERPTKGPMVDSRELLSDPEALRERGEREGYLFIKGFFPKEDLLELRRGMLEILDRHGWLDRKHLLMDGMLDLAALSQTPESEMRTDIGVSLQIYREVQKLESFHRIAHHPLLYALYEALFGEAVLPHPRHIGRMVTSHPSISPTPPHQDFPLIQGSIDTWTCWFPLGDVPRSRGGLSVLKASHLKGYFPIVEAKGAGGIAAQLCPDETEWLEMDYELGDLLTFPSFTVHKALRAQEKNRVRLSCDMRFQKKSDIIENKSLLPHVDLTWEEIYQDWKNEELKYYWKKGGLNISPWDDTLMQPSKRIC